MVKRSGLIAVLICLVVLESGFVSIAHANAGPPIRVEDGDASFLVPIKHDSIEVVSEDLTYDVTVSEDDHVQAQVTAVYTMRNTSGDRVPTLMAFVANNPEMSVDVTLDGSPVKVLESVTMPWNVTGETTYVGDLLKRQWSNVGSWTDFGAWEPTFEEILGFASTGQRTGDISVGYDLELSMFELTLDAGATHTVCVSYTENAAVITENRGYIRGYGNPTAEFYYFLEPAQYWKDFSDLTVTVKLPKGIGFESSLDGFVREGNAYVAKFSELPEKNLRLLVRMTSPSVITIAAWVLAVGFVAVGLIVRVTRRRHHRVV